MESSEDEEAMRGWFPSRVQGPSRGSALVQNGGQHLLIPWRSFTVEASLCCVRTYQVTYSVGSRYFPHSPVSDRDDREQQACAMMAVSPTHQAHSYLFQPFTPSNPLRRGVIGAVAGRDERGLGGSTGEQGPFGSLFLIWMFPPFGPLVPPQTRGVMCRKHIRSQRRPVSPTHQLVDGSGHISTCRDTELASPGGYQHPSSLRSGLSCDRDPGPRRGPGEARQNLGGTAE
ncbi:hypothetical protein GGR52DRAFT_233998 [Hypoxylon sp. FL1284]|nr:hypothetical protein GGR52DRAFT_233998 [Hypoxylon sp. FL1284]